MLCQGVLTARSLAVKCSMCKAVSDTFDPCLDLPVEITVPGQGQVGRSSALQGMFLQLHRYCSRLFNLPVSGTVQARGNQLLLLRCLLCLALTSPLSWQQAANVEQALELFVKPDLLGGENAYLCDK